ncbi:hypothetical protein EJ08DRAFT_645019 [Tothia fuscella]|uniref:Uncharacterized protein n=1 Tax=Tothia fuscella TaxID=1048955 RepID=A0A9P4P3J1_9PEZI|nr:hypothetical protein EJ08DRAFT_645019 [Tothia fuscella]
MKNLALSLLFAAAANGAAIQKKPRQLEGSSGAELPKLISSGGINFLPKQKAYKIEQIEPRNADAKRVKITYGPYKLRAANSTVKIGNAQSMDKGGTSYQYLVDDDFPRDITVLQSKSMVTDENFKREDTANGIYNHHNVFMDITKSPQPAYACEGRKAAGALPYAVFTAGATEVGDINYSSTSKDIKTGYHLSKNRALLNSIDTINYNNFDKTVYTVTEIEYLEGTPAGYIDTFQALIDPSICGGVNGAAIHPPKGVSKFNVNSTGIIAARDGYILNIRGHLHDGGINIQVKINDKEVCNSKAAYGGEGHVTKTPEGRVWETIRETSTCYDPIKVKKGDKIYMQANYDLDLHPSREMGGGHGAMAMGSAKRDLANVGTAMDGDAEQMALVVTYFAPI